MSSIMNEKFCGLFFGRELCDEITFKKSILLYDELNFLDRPCFKIMSKEDGREAGTVARLSPMREFAKNTDIKINCYSSIDGNNSPALYDSIEEDLNDQFFVNTFLKYFLNDFSFFCLFINPIGSYGASPGYGSNDGILGKFFFEKFKEINWDEIHFSLELFDKYKIRPFTINSKISLIVTMFIQLATASYFLNSSLISTIQIDAVPFTSFEGYNELLKVKYNRAIKLKHIEPNRNFKVDYIAHTIFDEIINPVNLQNKSIKDIVKFKNNNIEELSEFRKYLNKLQYQIENETINAKFEHELEKLISLEVLPMADKYKEELKQSWETMFGEIVGDSIRYGVPSGFIASIFTGMPLETLIGAVAAWSAKPVVDYILSRRQVNRTNGLSYLLKM